MICADYQMDEQQIFCKQHKPKGIEKVLKCTMDSTLTEKRDVGMERTRKLF